MKKLFYIVWILLAFVFCFGCKQQIITIENETLCVSINKTGAELWNIFDKDKGVEYLWQGDPKYWSGRAPIMFPVNVRFKDEKFTFKDKMYDMPRMGLAKDADFKVEDLTSEKIYKQIHTPQPFIYLDKLERLKKLQELFLKEEIDILKLNCAYDFIAIDSENNETLWTMLPPLIEEFKIPSLDGKYDYTNLLNEEVREFFNEGEVIEASYTCVNEIGKFKLINDGSHRVHMGFKEGGINVLIIKLP